MNTKENTVSDSYMDKISEFKPWNSDDLYQKTGDYSIYEEMLNDEQVSISIQLKTDLVLASGWEIKPYDDDQTEMVEDLTSLLVDKTDRPLDEMLEEMCTSYWAGFSLSEKLFKKLPNGYACLKNIKTRHPSNWIIHTDQYGNVTDYEQYNSHYNEKKNLKINPKSLIHMINNPKFDNPYGYSDLRKCYSAYYAKKQFIRYFGQFVERVATPKAILKYSQEANVADVTKIFNTLKKLQNSTTMAIPEELKTEFLEAKSNGDIFIKALNIFNMFIGRALFIPDLLGLQGSETSGGSHALGKEQMDVFFRHIMKKRIQIERIVNQHIIKPLCIWNYGISEKIPEFKLCPLKEEKAEEWAKIWVEAVKGKIYKPTEDEVNHFRSLIKFPEGEVDFVESKPEFEDPSLEKAENQPLPNADENLEDQSGFEDTEIDKEEKDLESIKGKKEFGRAYAKNTGDFHKKVNFKLIEKKLDTAQEILVNEMKPIIDFIYEDVYDQIDKKKILSDQNIDRIGEIKIPKKREMKLMLKKNFKQMYVDAKKIAESEIFKQNFAKPIVDEDFLKILDREIFKYVGDWEYTLQRGVEVELIAAIKDGRPLSSVIDILDSKNKKESLTSVERYSRTKYTEVMNKGRLAFFNESKVVSGYQYSAILDGRTTPICRGLHNKKFKSGTEPVPPMHFNCRSVLIPITIYEEFKPDSKVGKKNIEKFIEDNLGKGFPKQ